ncbi:hypothetical protein D3272_25275, partial [Lichenibacterium ramalinae]
SAQEQASGLDQVNGAINQMDQVTQQNAAMVEESTAASHGLARDAEALMAIIGGFKVGVPASANRRPTPARASASPAPVVALRSTGQGGAAAKPAAEAAAWDEF